MPSTPAAEIRQDDKQRRQFQIFFHQLAVLPCLAVLGFRCCFTCSLLLLGMLLRPHPHPYYSDALFQPAGCWLGTKTRSFSRGDNLKWELARSIIRIDDAIAGRTIIGLCKPALSVVIGPHALRVLRVLRVLHPAETPLCIPAGRKWWHALWSFRLAG